MSWSSISRGRGMKTEYCIVLGCILAGPLLLSGHRRLRIYSHRKALFKAMLAVSAVYWIWDVIASARGHWSFNPLYVVGVDILGMPVEEWLFFPVLAFVSVFTWEAVKTLLWKDR